MPLKKERGKWSWIKSVGLFRGVFEIIERGFFYFLIENEQKLTIELPFKEPKKWLTY